MVGVSTLSRGRLATKVLWTVPVLACAGISSVSYPESSDIIKSDGCGSVITMWTYLESSDIEISSDCGLVILFWWAFWCRYGGLGGGAFFRNLAQMVRLTALGMQSNVISIREGVVS